MPHPWYKLALGFILMFLFLTFRNLSANVIGSIAENAFLKMKQLDHL